MVYQAIDVFVSPDSNHLGTECKAYIYPILRVVSRLLQCCHLSVIIADYYTSEFDKYA